MSNASADGQKEVQPEGSRTPSRWPQDDKGALNRTDPNAILKKAESKGASDKTARQDKLPQRGITGVQASEAMAETDRTRVIRHKAKFQEAARKFNLPPALLAAIASRECRGGNILKKGFG